MTHRRREFIDPNRVPIVSVTLTDGGASIPTEEHTLYNGNGCCDGFAPYFPF